MFKVRWGLPLSLSVGVLLVWLFQLGTDDSGDECRPVVELATRGAELSLSCIEHLPSDCVAASIGDRALVSEGGCEVIAGGMSAESRLVLGLPLLLNRVSVEELQLLRGVGEKTARAIVEKREAQGGFRSIDDLLEVDGIGAKRLEALRRVLKVSNSRENRSKVLDSSTDGD